jgi:uncharacterized membrane protein HdeD (DUF308 family)
MATSLRAQFSNALIFRGILGVLFGILTFIMPLATIGALVILFGAFSLVDGIVALVGATRAHSQGVRPWPYIIEGVLGIGAGIVTLLWPGITAFALLMVIAAWSIVGGVFRLIAAVRLRRVVSHEWLLVLSGIAGVAFGVIVILYPVAGALGVVTVLGAYAFVVGIFLIGLGLRLRRGPVPVPA